ncbi:hypothetical protein H4219_002480 [Mycoemilia scoparia]|uniref:Patatin-like phospholipase domain-containing protein n=1 Tax=Mycoemilia scoparia TaxID=417184 RepID=A0A9W7ZXD8_9FUNG|nr:hypothetical protein H4219_002480 [Mycoemilia scoparia]
MTIGAEMDSRDSKAARHNRSEKLQEQQKLTFEQIVANTEFFKELQKWPLSSLPPDVYQSPEQLRKGWLTRIFSTILFLKDHPTPSWWHKFLDDEKDLFADGDEKRKPVIDENNDNDGSQEADTESIEDSGYMSQGDDDILINEKEELVDPSREANIDLNDGNSTNNGKVTATRRPESSRSPDLDKINDLISSSVSRSSSFPLTDHSKSTRTSSAVSIKELDKDRCSSADIPPWEIYMKEVNKVLMMRKSKNRQLEPERLTRNGTSDVWHSPLPEPSSFYKRLRETLVDPLSFGEVRSGTIIRIFLRYCLIVFTCTLVFLELILYGLVRLCIHLYETLWVIHSGTETQILMGELEKASDYDSWASAAKSLDIHLGMDKWKSYPYSCYYDADAIEEMTEYLIKLRGQLKDQLASGSTQNDDKSGSSKTSEDKTLKFLNELMQELLNEAVHHNVGGCDNHQMWSQTFLGTKPQIYGFVEQVTKSLYDISDSTLITPSDKHKFFKAARKLHGRTALCLSGGISRAYYHVGVLKALLEDGPLPSILTGSSGGSVLAAMACVYKDDELKALLDSPDIQSFVWLADKKYASNLNRLLQTSSYYHPVDFIRNIYVFCRGNTTFKEAYQRTGKILNVGLLPYSTPFVKPKTLNYLNCPDVLIWSAVLASCSAPMVLPPTVLMQKLKNGQIVAYTKCGGEWWADGTLGNDVPKQSIQNDFNVKYTIISQVGPHVAPFWFDSKGSPGDPVVSGLTKKSKTYRGGFLLSCLEKMLKIDMLKWFKWLDHLDIFPMLFQQRWCKVWSQTIQGTVNIVVKRGFPWDVFPVPLDKERLEMYRNEGMRQTWPKLDMIRCRIMVEHAINEGIERAKMQMQ